MQIISGEAFRSGGSDLLKHHRADFVVVDGAVVVIEKLERRILHEGNAGIELGCLGEAYGLGTAGETYTVCTVGIVPQCGVSEGYNTSFACITCNRTPSGVF